jgi:hypothetical protein
MSEPKLIRKTNQPEQVQEQPLVEGPTVIEPPEEYDDDATNDLFSRVYQIELAIAWQNEILQAIYMQGERRVQTNQSGVIPQQVRRTPQEKKKKKGFIKWLLEKKSDREESV